MNPLLVIPSRLASRRFPRKALARIEGDAMIAHVWRRAMASGAGRVVVACAEEEVAEAVRAAGGETVMTSAALPSGTDRVFEAAEILDAGWKHDAVVNIQGDMPFLPPEAIGETLRILREDEALDMATLATPIETKGDAAKENIVKAILSLEGRALYFTRGALWGSGVDYRHIGIYGFRREALRRFAALPPSPLEIRENLEQLRALEAGMRIGVGIVAETPGGVDTPQDLEKLKLQRKGRDSDPSR